MNKINISLLEKNNIQVSLKNKQNVSTLANENVNVNYDKNFFHRQTVSSDTWTIVHNLRKYPSVSVLDSAGNEVIGDITYDNENQVTIKFAGAFKGNATLN